MNRSAFDIEHVAAMKPSIRLRLLNFGMRYRSKPKLRRTKNPQDVDRGFERDAKILFSAPKGLTHDLHLGMPRFQVGAPGRLTILYLHGGAFVTGSAQSYRSMAGRLSQRTGAAVYLPEYPLLQQAPFPAAPKAVRAAWDRLVGAGIDPRDIAIAGDSAGGNLVFGLLASLLAEGVRPASVAALSPWGDLTLSSDTLTTHADRDALLPPERMQELVELYLDGADPTNPLASPVLATYPDPPPVLIQVGEEEILLGDAHRLAAKTNAKLSIWPHVPHVWQMFDGRLPEANRAMQAVASFLQTSFESARR